MSIGNYIASCKSYSDFLKKTSKLQNKGSWSKNRIGKDVVFELLSKILLLYHPIFKTFKISNVWHETEIPLRIKKRINYPETKWDDGIDLIIEHKDKKYSAVQCKFLSNISDRVKIGEDGGLATFFNLSRNVCDSIEKLLVFATSIDPPRKNKLIPKGTLFYLDSFFSDLDNEKSTFTWNSILLILQNKEIKFNKLNPKNYQNKTLEKLNTHFKYNKRGCLFLPCGTGKTLIGYWFSNINKFKSNIILVPNLSLVSQTLKSWVNQNAVIKKEIEWLVVCSDKDINLKNDPFTISTLEFPFETTTDEKKIKNFIKKNKNKNFLIISTYNSAHKISLAMKNNNFKFDFAIFDEAHRTVGTKDKVFSKLLYDKNLKIKKRLFMTATKRVIKNFKDIVDMSDSQIYGNIAHEMSFKEAIESKEKILTDYKFISKGISYDDIYKLWLQNPNVRHNNLDATTMKYLSSLILMFKTMKKYNLKKGISFHNTIGGAENFKNIAEVYQKYLYPKNDIQMFHVSSKGRTGNSKYSIIKDFESDKKSVVTNARCLVEGVDVPAVDFVIFVDKKSSRTDIIQGIGRCLRLSKNKKFGYVLVPYVFDKRISREDFLKSEYSEIIKSIRVLALYDKTFADNIKLQAKSKKTFKNNKVEQ